MQIGGMYTIDFAKVSKIPKFEVTIKNGDSKRTVGLILLETGKAINLNNYTVTVAAKKSDGTDIFNDVKIIDAIAGICEVEITEQMLATNLDLPCEIILYGLDGTVASSSNFVVSKLSSIRNDKNIVSSNEFKALSEALKKATDIDRKMNRGENISAYQIDKNLGKFDQTYLTDELLQQITGNAPVHSTVSNGSITTEKVALNSIGVNEVTFISVTSENLFDKNTVFDYKVIKKSDGSLVDHEGGCASDFIKVNPNTQYVCKSNWEGAFYDSSKNYICGKDFGTTVFTTPSNACFLRYGINILHKDIEMLVKGDSFPDTYIPFEMTILGGISKNIEYKIDSKIQENNENIIIDANKTDFFNLSKSENLFNKNTVFDYKVIEKATGNMIDHEVGCASDFIKVNPNTQYISTSNWEGAFYDAHKKYISGKSFGTTIFTTPSNAYFFRYSLNMLHKDTEMLVKGELLPDIYIPYKSSLLFAQKEHINSIFKQLHCLNGKKWVVVGDSLTEKNIRTSKHYYDFIEEKTGVIIHNMGVGGTGYKRQEENNKSFYQRIDNIPTDADIITIFGSGNDLGGTVGISKLGNPSDSTTDTICGCVNETLKRLFNRIPGARVGIVLPCPWGNYPPSQVDNPMAKYSEALKEVAKRHSVPVLDLYYGSNLRPWDETFKQMYYKKDDGNSVHPDEDGHYILHNKFLSFIESL